MSKAPETVQPPRVHVRLVWRLVLCLFGNLVLLLFLAVYLVLSLNSVRRYAPIVQTEEVQLESLDTIPSLLGVLDLQRLAYARTGDDAALALYRQTRGAVETNLASLDTPLLLPSETERQRRLLVNQWLTTVGDASVATRGKIADDPFNDASRQLLDRIDAVSRQSRADLQATLTSLQKEEDSEANGRVNLMWTVVGSITFITILLQLLLSNSIIGPIQSLGGVVRRMQAGDYTARARIHSGDEIQSLGETFNAMAENIVRNQQALQETNARLEERVVEKTEQIRHTLEELEDRNQKLNEAARLKDEFLATLSHELRTPLTPVISCAHLLGTDPELNAHQQKNVSVIDRNARALSRMIDELLDLSAVMNRKLRLTRETTEMNEWTRATLETMRPGWKKKKLNVTLVPAEAPIELEIDPTRLAQVLTNLINNAIKFTDEGGTITVSLVPLADQVKLTVRDTGLGLDREEIGRIFEMFHQERTPRTQDVGGLGVGLTVARSLAELHGGGLLAESDGPGRGSSFTILLPYKKEAAAFTPVPPSTVQEGHLLRGVRILLVEDSIDTREAMDRIFVRRGCVVRTAASGEEALRLAGQETPEVLISDIGLPGMSGLELVRKLRAEMASSKIIAVALSGLGREQDVVSAQAAGFDAHLLKPVEIAVLEQTVIELMRKQNLPAVKSPV